jgi:transcriptional regulator with XRE-family HTH domain
VPRRSTPEPLAAAVGRRVRVFREEAKLTIEALAYESELGSKGHLSDIEAGLVIPTIRTLKTLADRLDVHLLDLVTFPDEDVRQQLVNLTRKLPSGTMRRLVKEMMAGTRRGG